MCSSRSLFWERSVKEQLLTLSAEVSYVGQQFWCYWMLDCSFSERATLYFCDCVDIEQNSKVKLATFTWARLLAQSMVCELNSGAEENS